MVKEKTLINAAIKALEKDYVENGAGHDIHYVFGYFDALAALKDFKKHLDSDKRRVPDVV